MNNHWSGSRLSLYAWKDPSRLHGFDRGTAPFHTNGNDAFCFSVTEERFPIFRSHCQVVHSCISLHAFVWGTGNDCWQHNGSMRIQYKSLIMPESWTAALRCTHHSGGTISSRLFLEASICKLFWLHCVFTFPGSRYMCIYRYLTEAYSQIKPNNIPVMRLRLGCLFISQSLFVILNPLPQKKTSIKPKTQVAYELGHLKLNQKWRHKTLPYLMLWPGRFDLEHHYVSGVAFHANRFSKPGSSLLMALPIKLEAHTNTNSPSTLDLSPQVPSAHSMAITAMCFPSWN